jgi:Xaa-Pro aminopeptidase
MCVGQHAALTAAKDGARLALKPVSGLVERLRVIKDMDEIARMERSNALNHRVFAMVPELLEPGRTEMDVAWDLEKLFRDNGASELAFPSIVAVGPNGALPHAIPGQDRVLGECPVLVDMGCRLDGYCSDQTRTFWVGEHPTDAFRATLELVQEAQARAIERMRPGEPASGAYKAARDYFARHGVADHFTHSLGHGVGLDTHEAPSANPSNDAPFQPGMVVTAEPGLYYPEWGGVRWEYMVLITETGARVL